MSDKIFKEENGCILYGECTKYGNGSVDFSEDLVINIKNRTVETRCGDWYFDMSFPFDDILAIADKIKEIDKK